MVGTFQLMHIPGQEVRVVLIPLGNAVIPGDIGQTISRVFDPLAISIDIGNYGALPLPSDLLGPDGAIETDQTATFANYSTEQQAINQYIRDLLGENYHPQTYYLLITDAPSSTDLAGYMPLARQFGYIFKGGQDEAKSSLENTAAHELGHGVFGLEHPFSRFGIPVGSTDWLMDYSTGTTFPYVHWAQMYDPEFRLYLFQDEEEGAQIVSDEAFIYSNYVYFAYTHEAQPNYAGITPSGQQFILPQDAVASFYPQDDGIWPQGCLAGFRIGSTPYFGWWNKSTDLFLGYATGYIDGKGKLVKEGAYYPSPDLSQVPVFIGKSSVDCNQQVYWQELGIDLPVYDQASKISPVNTGNFTLYEEQQVAQSPCGCFQGDCSDLLQTYQDHPYLTMDNILQRVICQNPCVLKGLQHHSFFAQPTSEWMENLNNICASLLAFGFSPAILAGVGIAAEGLLVPILESIAAQSVQQLALRFSLGSVTDMLIQRAVHYYFPSDGQELAWAETLKKVDLRSTIASGFESILVLNSKMGEAGVSAAISCYVDGNLSDGTVKAEFNVQQCAKGALSALAFHGRRISKAGCRSALRCLHCRPLGGWSGDGQNAAACLSGSAGSASCESAFWL